MPKTVPMKVPMALFSKLGRAGPKRESLLRNLLTACIVRDRIVTTYTRAREGSKMCNIAVDLAKNPTAANMEILESMMFQHAVAMPKFINNVLPRYVNRTENYTRVIRCSHDPTHRYQRAILEFVDAPGDTMVALAALQIPAISKELAEIAPEIAKLKAEIMEFDDIFRGLAGVLRAEEIPLRPRHWRFEALERKRVGLQKRLSELEEIQAQKYLPKNYKEQKSPGPGEDVVVDSFIMRTEPEEIERKLTRKEILKLVMDARNVGEEPNLPSNENRQFFNSPMFAYRNEEFADDEPKAQKERRYPYVQRIERKQRIGAKAVNCKGVIRNRHLGY